MVSLVDTIPSEISWDACERGVGFGRVVFVLFSSSETATATSATDLLMVRKDDLVDILHQWPEVMSELTDEAERHFRAIVVREVASQGNVYTELNTRR